MNYALDIVNLNIINYTLFKKGGKSMEIKKQTVQNEQSNIDMSKYKWDKSSTEFNANIDMSKSKWDKSI